MELFHGPLTLPGALRFGSESERQVSRGILGFFKRSADLLQAAGLIDAAGEPGLVFSEDRMEAGKLGEQAANTLPRTSLPGRAEIGYLRSLTVDGLTAKRIRWDQLTVLKDACGLANAFLCSLALKALEKGHRVQLCPSLLDPEKLEAVLLPELGMAWISDRVGISGATLKLDEIPDPERRYALKEAIKRDRTLQQALIQQAAEQMQMAGILYQVFE
mgnify:CR=1 FL=1